MAKKYAIGDLHGRFDLLRAALSAAEKDAGPEGGTFIVLGDMVDRGPQSSAILDLLSHGPTLSNWEWVVLMGNHEDMMLQCIGGAAPLSWWIGNGGGQTLMSYGYKHGDQLHPLKGALDKHLTWVAGLPTSLEDEHRIFVHAGLPPHTSLADTKDQVRMWMLYQDGNQYGGGDVYPDEPHVSGKHIVHGHHQSASHPLLLSHRTNLDTFAWHEGRIVIGVFDDDVPGGPIKTIEVKEEPNEHV